MADTATLSGIGGLLQGFSSVLVPHIEQQQRIKAADDLSKRQQLEAAIRQRVQKHPELLRDPTAAGAYLDTFGLGSGKSKPEDVLQLLTAKTSDEMQQEAAQAEFDRAGSAPDQGTAGLLAAGTGLSPNGPGSSAAQVDTEFGGQLPESPSPAPAAPPPTLQSKLAKVASEPGGISLIEQAYGHKAAESAIAEQKLSLGERKLAATLHKADQPKLKTYKIDTGSEVQVIGMKVNPDLSSETKPIITIPKSNLSKDKSVPINAYTLALSGELQKTGLTPEQANDAIKTRNLPKDIIARATKRAKQSKVTFKERVLKEYNARSAGQPAGSGDPELSYLPFTSLERAVSGPASSMEVLMNDADSRALYPQGVGAPPATAPAGGAPAPPPSGAIKLPSGATFEPVQ